MSAVTQFCDITGASKKQAQSYLKKASNNVELAVANWFDAGDSPEADEPVKVSSKNQSLGTKTYSCPGVIEIIGPNPDSPPRLENWTGSPSVRISKDGTSFDADSYYSWGSARANVKVNKGKWYYEVTMRSRGSARIGWSTEVYKPENDYEGCGSDGDSWAWDGSKQTKYHDEKKDDSIKSYGQSWAQGDVIGCSLDFDNQEIKYYINGKCLGAAFKNVRTLNPLMPCLSIYRNTDLVINLGPKFQYKPSGFYGLNPSVTTAQADSIAAVFSKYQRAGATLSDSLAKDLIHVKGVMALGEDLGATGPLDPQVLLLAWKLRSKKFFEFYDSEWNVLWANEQAYTWNDMFACVQRWVQDIKTPENFKSFYAFTFDYMKMEKGDRATVLEKQDARMLWDMLGLDKKFHFYKQWLAFWEEGGRKGVTKDTWMMLLVFIDEIGSNINAYNEDDCWNSCFDDFVDFLKSN
eukprot:TRINITY_DN12945_c0_g1_i1.p1 TRINITY_DN12945_c0_g1~~TRINITY_DN12945_c0_g1_i1.p1  ORF type:complete len:471 (+),score=100.99 TRINITY_DN12945_c0_g1_i1:22-1413(+)